MFIISTNRINFWLRLLLNTVTVRSKAQAYECIFEKLQWRLLASVRHRCRLYRGGDGGTEEGVHRRQLSIDITAEASLQSGDRRGRGVLDHAIRYRRTSATTTSSCGSGMNDVTTHTPSWTELAREAAHVSDFQPEIFCGPFFSENQT